MLTLHMMRLEGRIFFLFLFIPRYTSILSRYTTLVNILKKFACLHRHENKHFETGAPWFDLQDHTCLSWLPTSMQNWLPTSEAVAGRRPWSVGSACRGCRGSELWAAISHRYTYLSPFFWVYVVLVNDPGRWPSDLLVWISTWCDTCDRNSVSWSGTRNCHFSTHLRERGRWCRCACAWCALRVFVWF